MYGSVGERRCPVRYTRCSSWACVFGLGLLVEQIPRSLSCRCLTEGRLGCRRLTIPEPHPLCSYGKCRCHAADRVRSSHPGGRCGVDRGRLRLCASLGTRRIEEGRVRFWMLWSLQRQGNPTISVSGHPPPRSLFCGVYPGTGTVCRGKYQVSPGGYLRFFGWSMDASEPYSLKIWPRYPEWRPRAALLSDCPARLRKRSRYSVSVATFLQSILRPILGAAKRSA